MRLCDRTIWKLLSSGQIGCNPPIERDTQLQPASLDLRLGSKFLVPSRDYEDTVIDPSEHSGEDFYDTVEIDQCLDVGFQLNPMDFALGHTQEVIELPDDIVGFVDGRSTYGRWGIQVHITAGLIDPGFKGSITLEFHNVGEYPVLLKPGVRICQISFAKLDEKTMMPYGVKPGSKYQGDSGVSAGKKDSK